MRLVVLDVGEGQAVLLQREEHGVLVDTGHAGMARHVLERLAALGVQRLDYLFLTHLHPDHASGYFRIREAFPDTPVVYNFHPLPRHVRPDMVRWVDEALSQDEQRIKMAAGDVIQWRGAAIEALWPETFTGHNLNRHSLVLQVRYGKHRALLMGDADKPVERQLLQRGRVGPVELLVVGHHGAADSGDEEFLARTQPRYSAISVNKDNIRGYPAAETLALLRRHSGKVLRTDRDGEVCFLFPGDGTNPRPCRPRSPRLSEQ